MFMYIYNEKIYVVLFPSMEKITEEFNRNFADIVESADVNFLVAVSGGVDSMVLCDLLLKTNRKFSVAHCNFQLRGNDSDEDEKFVRNYCIQNQIEFHFKKFNVKEFKSSGNYSTQMAARELRYAWFRELLSEYEFDYLLTAHHLNDSLETFLINLSRGTGINGLTGIPVLSHQILRPLYNFSKNEILHYAKENDILWREDISNAQSDYNRNRIRHLITPVLEKIHPEFLQNFAGTTELLKQDRELIGQFIELKRKELFEYKKSIIHIPIAKLKSLSPLPSCLYYLFSGYGFRHPSEIEKLMNSGGNGEITSKSHRLVKNRDELLLSEIRPIEPSIEFMIEEDTILEKPVSLKISKSGERDFSAIETLDCDKIKFPLRLRKIKTGDIFFPFGMKGSKRLSKFFKDEKFSKFDKESCWLMVDKEDKILYVVGKRIDGRFKITEHTHKFLNIYLC